MENSNSLQLCGADNRKKNDTTSTDAAVHEKETPNENRKNGLNSSANDMSQTVCLFRKYLLARTQQHNVGKTNMEESEVINKTRPRRLIPHKFNPHNLSRPQSLLERKMFRELGCDSKQSTPSGAKKASKAQLTIFYDGVVNVYDNVSAEKAKEMMLILDGGSSSSKPVYKEAPRPDFRASPHKSSLNSAGNKLKSAIPLARKHSLQCFVEKRRDRITSTFPYAVASHPSNGGEREDNYEAETDTDPNDVNRHPLFLSPFPSRLGCFFPVSANKGCY